eukprot:m.2975 g.2975  ORF g.2975 m.2975 type:complete len:416 (+) comp2638_c0_seq1:222-1469(+)
MPCGCFGSRRSRRDTDLSEEAPTPYSSRHWDFPSDSEDPEKGFSVHKLAWSTCPMEVSPQDLQSFEKRLDRNAYYGEVWKAKLWCEGGGKRDVVIRSATANTANVIRERKLSQCIQKEAAVLAQVLYHPNVLGFCGVITGIGGCRNVYPYCSMGSLRDVLKLTKGINVLLSVHTKLEIITDICAGMLHIHSADIIHGNLNARNVLLHDNAMCKVANFGVPRETWKLRHEAGDDEFHATKDGHIVPLRWSAPQVLQGDFATKQCDVWAMGMTMIQIFQDGEKPFKFLTNDEVEGIIRPECKHPRPKECPMDIYAIIKLCWNPDRTWFNVLQDMCEGSKKRHDGGLNKKPRASLIDIQEKRNLLRSKFKKNVRQVISQQRKVRASDGSSNSDRNTESNNEQKTVYKLEGPLLAVVSL